MSIYFGNDTVNDLYIGLTPVTKGYVGTHLFYNGDNTIIDLTYEKYILNTQSSTLYNTAEKPVKSAILKGNTGCRDIDTGEILEAFEKGRNLELVSVKMPGLTTSNEDGTKTNILTVNEDVELRGIGEVKDELNLVTGELNQYVGQTIYTDGSAFYIDNPYKITEEKTIGFRSRAAIQGINQLYGGATVFSSLSGSVKANSDNPGVSYQWHSLIIRVNKEDLPTLNIAGLDTYLKERPLVVQYELATEVVKTVDLSIVNQDGNDTNLSTFNDITHVMVSSGGLIPVVELEVATKNEEVLNTMSLEMDNISTTQNALEETSNAQSENVDATMIATTEIYEQLL